MAEVEELKNTYDRKKQPIAYWGRELEIRAIAKKRLEQVADAAVQGPELPVRLRLSQSAAAKTTLLKKRIPS